MLVHEGLGYNRFGLPYISAEEMEARRKRVLEKNPADFGKNAPGPYHETPQEKHKKHLKKMEEDKKAKVRQAQIMSFLALAMADMSVGLFHLAENNPTQATDDILCGATAFAAAACFTVPLLKKIPRMIRE